MPDAVYAVNKHKCVTYITFKQVIVWEHIVASFVLYAYSSALVLYARFCILLLYAFLKAFASFDSNTTKMIQKIVERRILNKYFKNIFWGFHSRQKVVPPFLVPLVRSTTMLIVTGNQTPI